MAKIHFLETTWYTLVKMKISWIGVVSCSKRQSKVEEPWSESKERELRDRYL